MLNPGGSRARSHGTGLTLLLESRGPGKRAARRAPGNLHTTAFSK